MEVRECFRPSFGFVGVPAAILRPGYMYAQRYIYIYIYIFDHCSRVIPTSYDAIVEMNDKGVGLAHVILFLSVLQLVFP